MSDSGDQRDSHNGLHDHFHCDDEQPSKESQGTPPTGVALAKQIRVIYELHEPRQAGSGRAFGRVTGRAGAGSKVLGTIGVL